MFELLEMFQKEEENLSGITRYAVGNDSRSLNQTATGIQTITSMSQQRLMFITKRMAQMFKRSFGKWIKLNQELVEEISLQTKSDGVIDIDSMVLQGKYDLNIDVGDNAAMKQQKAQSISMFLGQATTYGLDPKIMLSLTADLADVLDLNETEAMIRTMITEGEQQSQEQNQQAQMQEQQQMQLQSEAQDLEMAQAQASIAKDMARATLDDAKAEGAYIDNMITSAGGNR